ncbi:MAG: TolC family outer membrane protein [Pseudomonadota bacterium]|uniref:TolC family outer membrane protein n=1 Tax=Alcanivorax sp. TaxID=1872427 RepID=UPI0025BA7183|nr:TolC family outer membrane protein [Alcanivorax sp.]MED5240046.1 TolC family outer membrane protein [Pseudomonadota bacterium]MEE3320915.1 TolC family outer membrane protein [Pseudomonadota bacterium]
MKRSPGKTLVFMLTALASSVNAANLVDVANAAWSYDGTWRAARMNWNADQELLVQGRAALFPSVNASYGVYDNDREIKDLNFDESYDSEMTTVTLAQPLFRVDAWYGYKEAKSSTDIAHANFEQARQDFVLRVAQGYFGVLRAWDNWVSAKAEEKAIGRQLEQTQERFDVGLVPATDVEEAQATYDLTQVNLIVARQQYEIARDQLETLTGQQWETLAELKEELPMEGPQPAVMDDWIEKAKAENPQVLAALYNTELTDNTAKRQLGTMMPQVQLVAQYQNSNLYPDDNSAAAGAGSGLNSTDTRQIGIEVSMPLFQGGGLNSRRKEAYLRADAAVHQYDQTLRNAVQQTRNAYRTVEADALRIKAREQAIRSTRSALDATQSGYEVGTRNVVDVLNAQRALFAAERDYANARYDYIVDSLTLKSSTGDLHQGDLASVNQWLSSSETLNLYAPDLEGKSEEMMEENSVNK